MQQEQLASGFRQTTTQGDFTVELLEKGILRFRFLPSGQQLRRRSWSPVLVEQLQAPVLNQNEGELSLEQLRVRLESGKLQLSYAGQPFACDLDLPLLETVGVKDCPGLKHREGDELSGLAAQRVSLRKQMLPAEGYFGFGQRNLPLERSRVAVSNWATDAAVGHTRSVDPLYQSHPAFLVVAEGFCWGLFLNSSFYTRFDTGHAKTGELLMQTLGGQLEYFLFYGPDPAAVVERLTRLTGRPMLPPLWALGYHQSRWGYREASEILELAQEFRRRQLPLEVLHLDIDYMDGFRSFTFHPERFADPAALIEQLDQIGVRAVTIIDPGIKHEFSSGYSVSREGAQKDMFIREPGGSPYVGYCWPDAAMFPDFARPEVRHWWGEQQKVLTEAGVAGIWIDMNEPAIFDRPFSEGLVGHLPMPLATAQGPDDEPATHAELHNLYGSQMAQATFEGLRRLRPQQRPWVLTRSCFVGSQRHAASWMGDNTSWWEHLELSVAQLASMGLVGSSMVGVDIGGFWQDGEAELYARWIELGAFYPFMRTHTAMGTARQEPWSFGPEAEESARQALRLRYRLLPYLYTLAHLSHGDGRPMMRPLFYHYPHDRRCWFTDDQFLLGPNLLVAPVTKRGHRQRMIYFPRGEWVCFYSGRRFEPGAQLVEAPLGRAPLFLKAGAVLTLGNPRNTSAEPLTELTLLTCSGPASRWQLVEDDGISWQGPTSRLEITHQNGELTLTPSGEFTPAPRRLVWQVLAEERRTQELPSDEGSFKF